MQQTETCRDYLRGVCVRGPSCIYGHPPGLQGSQRAQSQICRDYLKGSSPSFPLPLIGVALHLVVCYDSLVLL